MTVEQSMKTKANVAVEQNVKKKAKGKQGRMELMKHIEMENEVTIEFDALPSNEGFARMAVVAFVTHYNPTVEEVADIKTAVSEAVTNAIIHGYENYRSTGKHGELEKSCVEVHPGKVRLRCYMIGGNLHIEVTDWGKGIPDVEQAMEPLFTTKPEWERSGMGFAFMEAFMDDLKVESEVEKGTCVRMIKKMGVGDWLQSEE